MSRTKRSPALWFFAVFLALSVLLMLAGQTLAVFDYELASRLGLQESPAQVGSLGVEVNRAFGVADTAVYIPLMILSLIGLLRGRRWALTTLAAVGGMSLYWTATVASILLLAPGTPGYSYVPGPEIWVFVGAYAAFGAWSLYYVLRHGDSLLP